MSSAANRLPSTSPAVQAQDEPRHSPQSDSGSFLPAPFTLLLRNYFRSGWAFLIPYLAAYLLYAWLNWPVNPSSAGEEIVKGISESGAGASGQGSPGSSLLPAPFSPIPSLLHVYWALHAVHVVLGIIALRSWWRTSGAQVTGAPDDSVNAPNRAPSSEPPVLPKSDVSGSTAHSLPLTVPHSGNRLPETVYRLLPWIFLGLLFYIPGIYLEWPSDPWEHLRRINEWHIIEEVTAHSSWKKSSYFLPYSLTGHTTGLDQLSWLNLFYTASCLLLSWQYYRLARAVGLGPSASFIFVVLNALTFGNSIFTFYRYYGLSSSIFAQIGAVALTRITLAILRPQEDLSLQLFHRFLRLLTYSFLLFVFTAFNHIQGLVIAGLGVLAVMFWRIIEWRRSITWWLIAAVILLNTIAVAWFYKHPDWDEIYRQGWLTSYHGFDVFSPSSPTWVRSLQILGTLGVINLLAGLWLVRRNQITGWLTLVPIFAIASPIFAIPLMNTLLGANQPILVFHRILFAIPAWLALVAAGAEAARFAPSHTRARLGTLASILIVAMLVLPANQPWFNRTFHFFAKNQYKIHNLDPLLAVMTAGGTNPGGPMILALPATGFRLRSFEATTQQRAFRDIWHPAPSADADRLRTRLANSPESHMLFLQDAKRVTSPLSTLGFLSGHWPSQHLSSGLLGQKEFSALAGELGGQQVTVPGGNLLFIGKTRPFLTPYNEVFLEHTAGPTTSLFCPPQTSLTGSILEVRGTSVHSSSEKTLTSPDSQPIRFFQDQTAVSWKMYSPPNRKPRLTGNSDFAVRLHFFQVRDVSNGPFTHTANQGENVVYDPTTPVLADVTIRSTKSSGGLFIDLPLDPTEEYVIEILGRTSGTVPSLRIESASGAKHSTRYLSLEGAGIRLKVQRLHAIKLLIYQDTPFSYDLLTLQVRLARSDSPEDESVKNVFSLEIPNEEFIVR